MENTAEKKLKENKLKIRPGIMEIKPYKPGSSNIKGVEHPVKLSSNETPLGSSPKAMTAYRKAAKSLNLYPDGSCAELRKAIGKLHHIDQERIVCGAGSDELIALLCQAYAGQRDEIIYSEHGFLMYPISAMRVGAKTVKVKEKNLRTDIEAIIAAVTDKTRIVFIANPNNPTGSYVTVTELKILSQELPDNVLLVIDSAYGEYVSEPDYTAGIDIVDEHPNVVMLRTFSKIYGLAALRIGWSYAAEEVTDVLNRVRGPFNVSTAAQQAAIAAINDKKHIQVARKHNDKWLKDLTKQINDLGLIVHPSIANFILIEFPKGEAQADKAYDFLEENGIILRKMHGYGLPHCLRMTIGLDKDNEKVVKCLGKLDVRD